MSMFHVNAHAIKWCVKVLWQCHLSGTKSTKKNHTQKLASISTLGLTSNTQAQNFVENYQVRTISKQKIISN